LYVNREIKKAREIFISLAFCFFIINIFFLNSTAISTCQGQNQYFLEIINSDSSDRLLSVKVEAEEFFYLEYNNSRDLNPVIDKFRIGVDGYIYLVEERYPWYGVGQECHPSRDIIFDDGMVVVKLNKKLGKLQLRVAYTVEQYLKIKNKIYLLSSIAKSGESIELHINIKVAEIRR
jgi:hypothetical protein